MADEKVKAQEARDLYILKQKAMQYYAENGVPQKMEEILNSTFYDCPNDVYGHIANYFEQFMVTPSITKVLGREAYDSNGQACLQAEVFGMVKNFERLLSTTSNSAFPYKVDPYTLKPDERQALEEERHKQLTDTLNMLRHTINDVLCGTDPSQQKQADAKMTEIVDKRRQEEAEIAAEKAAAGEEEVLSPKPESVSPTKGKKSPKGGKGGKGGKEVVIVPDEPAEISPCGCAALSLASQALCEAAAFASHKPAYQHIASLKYGSELPSAYRLPLPVATILSSGKQMPGKQNYVTEFMVVPKPDMPFHQAYKHINKIYHHCAQSLSAKTGAISRLVNEAGALCPTYDRPEQGLDLLQEAITAAGLTPGEDFNIILQLDGPGVFDYDKGKYEIITGMLKGPEDLADYWGDITTRYSSILAIIDPMRRVDKEGWMKLCERVTEHCHVIGDVTHHRAGRLIEEPVQPDWQTSGVVLCMHGQNTVTEIMQAAEQFEEAGCQVIIGAPSGASSCTFPVDLALGLQARFVKLGAPVRGENVCLYNYLLSLDETLGTAGSLANWDPHTFTLIKPPTPPPEDQSEEDAASPTKDKKI